MPATKIFRTMVGSENGLFKCDTIEHEGKLWLVPEWLEAPTEGWKTPSRIVCMGNLKYQKAGNPVYGDYILNTPVPKAVLDGNVPLELGSGPNKIVAVLIGC